MPDPITGQQVNWAEVALRKYKEEIEKEIQALIIKARDYYDGQFPTALRDELAKSLAGGELDEDFTGPNIIRTIIDSLIDRLNLIGLQVTTETTNIIFQDWVKKIGLASVQEQVHAYLLRDGEAFLLIDHDGFKPRLHAQQRYTDGQNGGDDTGCAAHYQNGELVAISKRWIEEFVKDDGSTSDRQRMTVYTSYEIQKYVMDGNEWVQYQDELDTAWPIPWTDSEGPLGIPGFHFSLTSGRPWTMDYWGMQIASDHTVAAILSAGQISGFPILFSNFYPTTDGDPPLADGSNLIQIGPRTIIGNTAEGADLKRIDSGNLSQLINSENQWMLWIAATSATPNIATMLVPGTNLSGETLKQFDLSQMAAVKKFQRLLGPIWEQVGKYMIRLHNAFGTENANLDPLAGVTAIWASAIVRDTATAITEIRAKEAMGVPREYLWGEFGYSADQILDMKRKAAVEELIVLLKHYAHASPEIAAALAGLLEAQRNPGDENQEESAFQAGKNALAAFSPPPETAMIPATIGGNEGR